MIMEQRCKGSKVMERSDSANVHHFLESKKRWEKKVEWDKWQWQTVSATSIVASGREATVLKRLWFVSPRLIADRRWQWSCGCGRSGKLWPVATIHWNVWYSLSGFSNPPNTNKCLHWWWSSYPSCTFRYTRPSTFAKTDYAIVTVF